MTRKLKTITDTMRLDWLTDKEGEHVVMFSVVGCWKAYRSCGAAETGETAREAIDAAIRAEEKARG